MNTLANIILSLPTKPTTADLLRAFIEAERAGYARAHKELDTEHTQLIKAEADSAIFKRQAN